MFVSYPSPYCRKRTPVVPRAQWKILYLFQSSYGYLWASSNLQNPNFKRPGAQKLLKIIVFYWMCLHLRGPLKTKWSDTKPLNLGSGGASRSSGTLRDTLVEVEYFLLSSGDNLCSDLTVCQRQPALICRFTRMPSRRKESGYPVIRDFASGLGLVLMVMSPSMESREQKKYSYHLGRLKPNTT